MAAPAFGSIGTRLAATTATPAVPVPAGVVAGDIIVVYMYAGATATVSARPADFAAAPNSPAANAGGVAGLVHIEWKRATGNDTGTYDFTLAASTSVTARAVRYKGAIATGSPWDVTAKADSSPTQTSTAPNVSVTTTGPDRLLCYTSSNDNGASSSAWAPPFDFNEREGGTNASKLEVADKIQAAPGITPNAHATNSANFATMNSWMGALIGTSAPAADFGDGMLLEGTNTTPAFGSIGTALKVTSATAAFPVPASVAAGDIIVVAWQGDTPGTTVTAVPTGFALAQNGFAEKTGSPDAQQGFVYWKRATGADSGTYSFTLSASHFVNGFATRYTGAASTGNPWDDGAAIAQSPSASQNAPDVNITTLGPNRLLVQNTAAWHGDEALWSPPAGMTERGGGSAANTQEVADKLQVVQGATGNLHASNTATAGFMISWLGALKGEPLSGLYLQEDSYGNIQLEPFPVYEQNDDLILDGGLVPPTLIGNYQGEAWDTTSSPKTTGTFNGLVGDVLVSLLGDRNYSTTENYTWSSTPAETWTEQPSSTGTINTHAFTEPATAILTANRTSMTVAAAQIAGGSEHWNHSTAHFRGSNGIGNAGSSGNADGAPSYAFTTNFDHSAIVYICVDWNAVNGASRVHRTVNGYTPTAANGLELVYTLVGSAPAYTVYVAYIPDAGLAGAKTIGLTAPTGQAAVISAAEVRGGPDNISSYLQEDGATLFQLEPKIEFATGDTIQLQSGADETIAHDATTRNPGAGSFATATGDNTFSHTPVGVPKGVVVLVDVGATADPCTGVLYGGVAMTLSADATSTNGRVKVYTLTTGIPTGTQTVTIQGCTATNKFFVCHTVTATTTQTEVNATGIQSSAPTSTDPLIVVPTTKSTMLFGGLHGSDGTRADYVVGSGYVRVTDAGYGATSAVVQRHNAPVDPGSVRYGMTNATSAVWGMAAVALAAKVDNIGGLLLEDASGGYQLEPLPATGGTNGTAVGSVAQGAGQSANGIATGIANVTGSLAQGAGQSANGVGSAGAAAVGSLAGQGAGQSASGTATATALVIGTIGQGAGQSRNGAGSAAGSAIGSIPGQGSGQSVSGAATGGAVAVGVASQGAGQSANGAASGIALVAGSAPGQGTGQAPSGTATAGTSATAIGTTGQGAGQSRNGAGSGAATATGVFAEGAGQGLSGTTAASASVTGTSGQASGQSRPGAATGAAGAVGSIGQGAGQSASGSTSAGATAVGTLGQGAGQGEAGTATGTALVIGTIGQGSGQAVTGSAVAGISATGLGTTAQGAGQSANGATTAAASVTGTTGQGAGQSKSGAATGGATALGTAAQGAGQAVNGSAVAGISATGVGTSAQAAGQGRDGSTTAAATATGTVGQGSGRSANGTTSATATATGVTAQGAGQAVNGSAIGGVSATAVGSSAQAAGQGRAATAGGGATGLGAVAQGAGQSRNGATTATASITGTTAQGTGQGRSGLGSLPATAFGSTAQGDGFALSGSTFTSASRFIHPRASGTTDRGDDGRIPRGSGAGFIYGYGVIPRTTNRIVRPNTGTIHWP